ncbi:hypothetical protein B0J11DRAFT_56015 [Dendryphion nanum]|uniref:FAD/NAD(P)-binding domain-containing protein n=1 Tax=Dendryphion nanum TaxID=256645 RepID=A0A9P9DKB7_9PLEO|nr:hypothetical protein B0J11DRAFT_56015 [Dendryphion nanum]
MTATQSSSDNSKKTIIILGASYAGISTAHYILKHVVPKFPTPSSYQVVLVSPSEHAMCRPACPRALISNNFFDQDRLFVSVAEQFSHYPSSSFQFLHGAAIGLDEQSRTVSVQLAKAGNSDGLSAGKKVLGFHTLVIATGASTPSPLHGLNASDRSTLQSHWSSFRKALPNTKTIVITGGGPSGVETAGELGEYLNGRQSGWFLSAPPIPKVKITLVCAGPQILPALRPGLASKAENMLAHVGVTVLKNTRVVSVSQSSPSIKTGLDDSIDVTSPTRVKLNNNTVLEVDLYIPATGTQANTSFIPAHLLANNGRVNANPQTFRLENTVERIYSIGDCSAAFTRPSIHNILSAIPILCSNIQRDLLIAENGGDASASHIKDQLFQEDMREMQLVPIGRSGGVGAAMGWALPGWLVWLIKGRDYWVWTTGRLWSGRQWA